MLLLFTMKPSLYGRLLKSSLYVSIFPAHIQHVIPSSVFQRQNFHTCNVVKKARSRVSGNPHFQPFEEEKWSIPRWKHIWLYMMKRKYELEGENPPQPRSNQLNWNYEAELRAFASRLHIDVDTDLLQIAFKEPLSMESLSPESQEPSVNNDALVKAGEQFTKNFINLYFKYVLPKLPMECVNSCVNYLTTEDILSYTASNLGYPDLVQTLDFPVLPQTLKRCFLASIAVILSSPGGAIKAASFVLDFVISHLVGKDIVHDIWKPQDPMAVLVKELASRNMPSPEIQLTKQSGINTVTPIFFVGIFCDKQLLAESGGETLIKAEMDAAKLALKRLHRICVNEFVPRFDTLNDPDIAKDIEELTKDIDLNFDLEAEEPEIEDSKPEQKSRGFFSRTFL